MGLQAGSVLVFGIDTPEETYGIVQEVNETDQTERLTARGALGDTVSLQEFDQTQTLSLNYLPLGTPTGTPAVGTPYTYNSTTWYIESIADGRTVDGWQTYDITATAYPNLGT